MDWGTALLTKAAGDLLGKVIDRWWPSNDRNGGGGASDDHDASSVIAKPGIYEALRGGLTENCARVLRFLEDGEPRRPANIREHLYPKMKIGAKLIPAFDGEFRYRLEYMLNMGLLARVGSEYAISRLGQAFVQRARSRKHYPNVFFRSGP